MSKRKTGTKEWSKTSVNVMHGCPHDCLYCYAKAAAIRYNRSTPAAWQTEKVNEEALERGYGKRKGRVMFPTSHDITLSNIVYCMEVLNKLLAAGNDVLIVSKPDPEVQQLIREELGQYRLQILFRYTIGSMWPDTLSFWEPGAPSFVKRLVALHDSYEASFKTSVSIEPYLDTDLDRLECLVDTVSPLVTDTIWIGTARHLKSRLKLNGHLEPDPHGHLVGATMRELMYTHHEVNVRRMVERLKARHKIRWKDSVREVIDAA